MNSILLPSSEEDLEKKVILSSGIVLPRDGGPPQRVILIKQLDHYIVAMTIISQFDSFDKSAQKEYHLDGTRSYYFFSDEEQALKKATKRFHKLCKKLIPLVIPNGN